MKFTKMHGLGNDFIIAEESAISSSDFASLSRQLCARRSNIGADGLVIIGKSDICDLKMLIFNSDGSEADMCGNALRCITRYAWDNKLVSSNEMTVETLAGVMRPRLNTENHSVTVDMGMPSFDKSRIHLAENYEISQDFAVFDKILSVNSVFMGNPHAVVISDGDTIEPTVFGPVIENHKAFPNRTNVNFVKIIDKETIQLTTWERGAGLTLACGTGSCAAVVITSKLGLTGNKVTVNLALGELVIEIKDSGRVFMTGPAEYVYNGIII